MIESLCRPWLPKSAFLGQDIIAQINACIHDWSNEWLAEGELNADLEWRELAMGRRQNNADHTAGLAVQAHADRRLQLASLLLARDVQEKHLRLPQDHALVDHIINEAMADLSKALSSLIAPAELENDGKFYALDIAASPDSPLITLSVSQDSLIAFALSLAPSPRSAKPPVSALVSLEEQEITIGGLLGSSEISLAEIERLQAGDVIILDQPANQALDLLVNGRNVAQAAASVTTDDQSHSLKIERSAQQW